MTLTLAGTSSTPERENAPTIQIKESWGDGWQTDHTIRLQRAVTHVPAHGLSTASFQRPYGGSIKHPQETALASSDALDIAGWWIRVGIAGGGGSSYSWVGQIAQEERQIFGVSGVPTGEQVFHAYGPLQLLRQHALVTSVWNVSGTATRVDWVPDMNSQDPRGLVQGNRSASTVDGAYVYDATGTNWTRRQWLDYLITHHLNSGAGPTWSVGGQLDVLDSIDDSLPLSGVSNAEQAVNMLVSRQLGLSWKIEETSDGFAIMVFALQAKEVAFGDAVLPANPGTFTFTAGEDLHHRQTTISRDRGQRYSRIRISGERVVVCGSLSVADSTLEAKWSSALATAYKAGTGTSADAPALHDAVRNSDRFKPVYQQFGIPSSYSPPEFTVGSDGQITTGAHPSQNAARETLTWTPLREGYDYGTNPATDNTTSLNRAEFRPPAAYAQEADGTYVHLEACGIGVGVPQQDLGIFLQANPPHVLARNNFSGAAGTLQPPKIDYTTLVATVAWESDERVKLEWVDPIYDDGSVLELEVPGVHLWYLAKNTVVGISDSGGLKRVGEARELRNDSSRLELAMAGAIARYGQERVRVRIELVGLHPQAELLGQVLTYVQADQDSTDLDAVVTSVEWSITEDGATTAISAGFAR